MGNQNWENKAKINAGLINIMQKHPTYPPDNATGWDKLEAIKQNKIKGNLWVGNMLSVTDENYNNTNPTKPFATGTQIEYNHVTVMTDGGENNYNKAEMQPTIIYISSQEPNPAKSSITKITPASISLSSTIGGSANTTSISSFSLATGTIKSTKEATINNVAQPVNQNEIAGNLQIGGKLTTTGQIDAKAGLSKSLTINGTTYNGSAEKTVRITPANIGAVPISGGAVLTGSLNPTNDNVDLGNTRKFKDGRFSGTVNASTFNASSDRRLKSNIEPIKAKDISKVRTYEYDKKDCDDRQVGVMAQELQENFPELVVKGDDGMLSVKESKRLVDRQVWQYHWQGKCGVYR